MLALLTVVAAAMAGLVVTYLLSPSKGRGRLVCFLLSDLVARVMMLAVTAATAVLRSTFALVSFLSPFTWLRLGLLALLAIAIHEFPTEVLEALDAFWREIITPMHSVVLFVLHQIRFIYSTGVGVYNLGVLVTRQLTTNTLIMVAKCDPHYVTNNIKLIINIFLAFLRTLMQWFGTAQVDSSFAVNEFNSTALVTATRELVLYQESAAGCICDGFKPVIEFAFNFIRPEVMVPLAFHATNFVVSNAQELLRVFPPYQKYPLFRKSFYHAEQAVRYAGLYGDAVLRLQLEWLFQLQPYSFELPPERFVMTTASHLANAFVASVNSLVRQVLLLPRAAVTIENFPDLTFRYLYLFLDDLEKDVEYFLRVLTLQNEKIRAYITPFVRAPMLVARALVVAAHALGRSLFHIFVDYTRLNFNIIKRLQLYDGQWYPRGVVPTCDYLLSTGNEVVCELGYGDTFIGAPALLYDPVGLPTIQKAIGLFEGGVKELTAIMDPLSGQFLEISLGAALETFRVVTRLLLSVDDLRQGNFFTSRIGDGYGVPRTAVLNEEAPTCSSVNAEGCTCNPKLPVHTHCQCIYTYPVNDMLTDPFDFAAASPMYCNSLIFEGLFGYLEMVDDLVFQALKTITPGVGWDATRGTLDIANYCKDRDFNLGSLPLADKTCSIAGSDSTLCNVEKIVGTAEGLAVGLAREIVETLVGFADGRTRLEVRENVEPRLCLVERALAAQAALIAAVIPEAEQSFSRNVAAVGFSLLRSVTLPIKVGMVIVEIFEQLLAGSLTSFDFIKDILRIYISYVVDVLNSFGNLFNGVASGTGDFLITVGDFLLEVETFLQDTVVEALFSFLETTMLFIEFLANPNPDQFPELIESIFNMIQKVMSILRLMVGKLWGFILDLLGPVGKTIKVLSNEVCNTIESIVCEITKFLDMIPGMDFKAQCDLGCTTFRADPLPGYSLDDVPRIAYHFKWDGSSQCDVFIHLAKERKFSELGPLEQSTLAECLSLRLLGEKLADEVGDPALRSVFYDWHARWALVADLGNHPLLWEWALGKIGDVNWNHLLASLDLSLPALPTPPALGAQWRRMRKLQWKDFVKTQVEAPRKFYTATRAVVNTTKKGRDLVYRLGQDTYTSLQPCSGEICFQCAVIDNLIKMLKTEIPHVQTHYDYYAEVVVPQYVASLEEAYETADPLLNHLGEWAGSIEVQPYELSADLNSTVSRDTQIGRDWAALLSGDLELKELFLAMLAFVRTPDDAYVKFFGGGLSHYLGTNLFEECTPDVVWSLDTTFQERQQRITLVLWRLLYMLLVLFALQFLGIPVLTFVVMVFPVVAVAMWLHTVYEYRFQCFPLAPSMFMDDILYFWQKSVPEPFCVNFPALAENCGTNVTTWRDPPQEATNLGYLYAPLLQLKNWGWLQDLNRQVPFSYILQQSDDIQLMLEVSDFREQDLGTIFFLDNVLVVGGAAAAVLLGFLMIPILSVVLQALALIPNALIIIYSLCADLQ